ncbi:hypothetical protein AB0D90_03495 [Streptomyces althioticus]|uniref:hypothetical protein n=1 Tax=Streptomyces althioticus TaxID=83380 RepID=UPI0033D0FA12
MRDRITSALQSPRGLELLVFLPLCTLMPLIAGIVTPTSPTWWRIICTVVAALLLAAFAAGLVLVMLGGRSPRADGSRRPQP